MTEFVGLPPLPPPQSRESLKGVVIEAMHFHIAHIKCLKENFVSHFNGPTEQFGMNLKGPRSVGLVVPQLLP